MQPRDGGDRGDDPTAGSTIDAGEEHVAGPVTRHGPRWSVPDDRCFGGANAEVHEGIEVSKLPEWVAAAWFAVEHYPSKEERDDAVEGAHTVYMWACTHGVGFCVNAARKEWVKRLLTIVVFCSVGAVGAKKTRSAQTSAASAG